MAVTYEKKQHEKAKADRLWLLSIDIDGRPAKTFGRLTFQGPASKEEADILLDAFKRIQKVRPKKATPGRGRAT